MNTENLPSILRIIAQQVSYSCQIPLEAAAVALSASLAGIGGTWDGARDSIGNPLLSRFSLIIGSQPGPQRTRLHSTLTATIERQAKAFTDYGRLLEREKIEYLLRRLRIDATERIQNSHLHIFQPDVFPELNHDYMKVDLLQKPAFYLSHPGAEGIIAGLRESSERLLLVNYLGEDFIDRLLEDRRGRADRQLITLLLSLMGGGQVEQTRGRGKPGIDLVTGDISLLVGATPDSLRRALKSRSSDVAAILARCAFLDLDHLREGRHEDFPPPPEEETGTNYWARLVIESLSRRRNLTDRHTLLEEPASVASDFSAYDRSLAQYMNDIPAECVTCFNEAAHWPVRLYGLFLKIENSREPAVWARLKQGAQDLATWLVEHQVAVIQKVWESSSEFFDEEEARMLRKLEGRGPLSFRDLLRSFAIQKSDLHRPVMERLLERGKIRLNDRGLLEAIQKADAA